MADKEYPDLLQIVGTVGRKPEIRQWDSGDDFVTLSLAVNRAYGDDDGTRWWGVTFSKQAVIDWVMENVRKGSVIAIEGSPYESTKNGTTYHNMRGFRVGFVDWFVAGGSRQQRDEDDDEDL